MKQFLLFSMLGGLLIPLNSSAQSPSPYIDKIYEYRPAPGQFVNVMPYYEEGDTEEDMRRKAEEDIAHNGEGMISLGGYGGYVVFGFDHMVENVPGEYDFKVLGNAFYANDNPNPDAPEEGGSCEPGIVMVAYDANGNGVPDEDEWYELAGSEYYSPETIHNYRITYYKPDENKIPTPEEGEYPNILDDTYIKWTDSEGKEGYITRNKYNLQESYYPMWLDEEELVFEGTKLADNYVEESEADRYYVLYAYPWGYADNHPNEDSRSNFKIEWAVDKEGNPVTLPGIHFVKVYTALNQTCGWLGEASTEVLGAQDLHLLPDGNNQISEIKKEPSFALLKNPVEERLIITSPVSQQIELYDSMGRRIKSIELESGTNYVPCGELTKGIYVLNGKEEGVKFIK